MFHGDDDHDHDTGDGDILHSCGTVLQLEMALKVITYFSQVNRILRQNLWLFCIRPCLYEIHKVNGDQNFGEN